MVSHAFAGLPRLTWRAIARSASSVALVYLILVFPWPLGRHYAAAYAWAGNRLVEIVGLDAHVRLAPTAMRVSSPSWDVDVMVRNGPVHATAEGAVKARFWGLVPMALFVALVLGTPRRWSQKLAMLAKGTLLMVSFCAAALLVFLLRLLSLDTALELLHPTPFVSAMLDRVLMLFYLPITIFTVPVLAWLASMLPWHRVRATRA
ncbi:MAG: hypothetical protein U1E76_03285 [Planctomycetota bacterium]